MTRNSKIGPDGLKKQLQAKSAGRRSRNAAATRAEAAASGGGRNDLQPDLKTVARPTDALKASSRRARVTKPEQVERVIRSIRQFGMVLPILIDGENVVVSGHIAWEAAKKLGFETIQCVVVDHLDPLEVDALSLALNRLGETGSWDLDILRERMIEICSGGIELITTGFSLPEIDQILIKSEPADDEEEGGREADDEESEPITREGDFFHLGNHTLLCGNALEEGSYRRVLDGREAHVVFSDPPYNCPIAGFVSGLGQNKHGDFQMACGEMGDEEFSAFLATYLGHCKAVSSKGAVIFACMDWRQLDLLLLAGRQVGLTRNNIAVWNKGAGGMTGSVYRSAHEFVVVFCHGKTPATNNVALGAHGRDRTNVWSYPGANRRGSSAAESLADHPTVKPSELVEDALLDVSRPGDVVLDPFMGSGSTIIAAERCGRIARGIELNPKYVDRAIRRWEKMTGERAVLSETGMTLAELAESRLAGSEVESIGGAGGARRRPREGGYND